MLMLGFGPLKPEAMHKGLEELVVNWKEKKEYFRIIISKTTS
jgi:hypothetical protein